MLVVLQVFFCPKSAATIIGGLDVGQVQAPHQMQCADRPIHWSAYNSAHLFCCTVHQCSGLPYNIVWITAIAVSMFLCAVFKSSKLFCWVFFGCYWCTTISGQSNGMYFVSHEKFIINILGTICAPNAASLQSMALRVLFQKLKHSQHGQWEQGDIVSDGKRGHRIRVRFH